MNKTSYTPGQQILAKTSLNSKEDALSAIKSGYQLTPELFSEIQKHLPTIIIKGIVGDEATIINCQVIKLEENQKAHVQAIENPEQKWAFKIKDLCNGVNNRLVDLGFVG